MELYKKEKINPLAGCLPIVVQIPVFFALYKVLFVTIEMRHAPFFGWIKDLSAPDPTNMFNLFGLIPFDPTVLPVIGQFLHLGFWPIVMGITMFVQMKLNPAPPDPTQKMIFDWMPLIFTFMLAGFSAGLVIYWAWNNTLSVTQQAFIMNKHGAKIELWDNHQGDVRGEEGRRTEGVLASARTMSVLNPLLAAAIAASLLAPATATAKSADAKRDLRITVHPKSSSRSAGTALRISPRLSPAAPLAEWRDRSPRHGGGDFQLRPPLLVRRRMALRLGRPRILSRPLERRRLWPVLDQHADRPDVELRAIAHPDRTPRSRPTMKTPAGFFPAGVRGDRTHAGGARLGTSGFVQARQRHASRLSKIAHPRPPYM